MVAVHSKSSSRLAFILGFLYSTCALPPTANTDRHAAHKDDPTSGAVLFRDLQTYAELGSDKRTFPGGAVHNVTRWLTTELEGLSTTGRSVATAGTDDADANSTLTVSCDLDTFEVNTAFGTSHSKRSSDGCILVVGGQRLECMPVWMPTAVSVTEVPMRDVAVVEINNAVYDLTSTLTDKNATITETILDAIAAGATAVLVFQMNTTLSLGEVFAINAGEPFGNSSSIWSGVPVVSVARNDHQRILNAAALDSLSLAGVTVENATSRNLVARLARDSDEDKSGEAGGKTLVLSTPLSGWHTCGGERGPGVALLLSMARLFAAGGLPGVSEVVLFGNSGHEIGSLGAEHTLAVSAQRMGLNPDNVAVWVSLGASIAVFEDFDEATGEGSGFHISSSGYSDEALGDLVAGPLVDAGYAPYLCSDETSCGGELSAIIEEGYRAFGWWGTFSRFHTAADDATSTSPSLLANVAEALAGSLRAVGQSAPSALHQHP